MDLSGGRSGAMSDGSRSAPPPGQKSAGTPQGVEVGEFCPPFLGALRRERVEARAQAQVSPRYDAVRRGPRPGTQDRARAIAPGGPAHSSPRPRGPFSGPTDRRRRPRRRSGARRRGAAAGTTTMQSPDSRIDNAPTTAAAEEEPSKPVALPGPVSLVVAHTSAEYPRGSRGGAVTCPRTIHVERETSRRYHRTLFVSSRRRCVQCARASAVRGSTLRRARSARARRPAVGRCATESRASPRWPATPRRHRSRTRSRDMRGSRHPPPCRFLWNG